MPVQEPLVSMPINSSIADSSLPGSGGLPDLMDTDKSLVGTSSAGASAWHIRAVSDVRKYVGEVDMDRVGGAAHRVSTEMNVAAKKLTGEMGDAAKKLSDLFGRTVAATRMSLKAAETGILLRSGHFCERVSSIFLPMLWASDLQPVADVHVPC